MNRRWPAGIALWAALWYASDSLRHRREGGRGYTIDDAAGGRRRGLPARPPSRSPRRRSSRGNQIELLINGDRIFPCFLETIRSARRTVNLLTYVYWQGDIAEEVAEAVCERARGGVKCRVLIDAVGAVKMSGSLIERMEECGVVVRRFRPPKPYAIRRVNNRTHRKILVVDGSVGLTGGVGIADEWTGDAHDPDHWRDTHVRVRGPVVRGLLGAFAENWLEATGEVIAGDDDLPELEPVGDGAAMQGSARRPGWGTRTSRPSTSSRSPRRARPST